MGLAGSSGAPRDLCPMYLLPGSAEELALGSFGDKILPANEMRRLTKLRVGLGEPDTSDCPGVCLLVGISRSTQGLPYGW